MATCSSILAWKIPWTEELGGLQPMGSQRVRHDWVTEHAHKQLYIAPNSGWAMVLCQQSCLWKSFHGPHSRHSPPSPSSPQMVTILSFLLVTSFCLITWMWICRQYSLVSTIKKKKWICLFGSIAVILNCGWFWPLEDILRCLETFLGVANCRGWYTDIEQVEVMDAIQYPTTQLLLLLFGCSVMSDSLRPHGLQYARLFHPSLYSGICSNSCPLSQWCYLTTPYSAIPFLTELHLQTPPLSGGQAENPTPLIMHLVFQWPAPSWIVSVVVVQLLSHVWLFATPWTEACKACPLLSPGVCSNPCPLSQWCHLNISSSAALFSSCSQSFPATGSFPLSWFFASGGQGLELQLQQQSFRWTFRFDFL